MSKEDIEKQISDIDSVILALGDVRDEIVDKLMEKRFYLSKDLEALTKEDCYYFREKNKDLFDSLSEIDLDCKSYDSLCMIKKAAEEHRGKLSEEMFKVLLKTL